MARVTFLCELAVFLLVVVCCVSSLRIAGPLRPCRRVRCVRPCPYGYVTIRGCQTCQCKDGPIRPPVCGPICKKFCPNGFLHDKKGCPTCTCRPCPHIKCSRSCPNGYKHVRGCQTCTCNNGPIRPPVCGPICKKFCPNGFLHDKKGCPTCTCRPCPHIRCSRSCPNGYKHVRGCQTCTCNSPPKPPVCGPICRVYCPNGFVKDRRGCPICECRPSSPRPCSRLACARSCLRGRPQPYGCSCSPCRRRGRDLPYAQ